MFFQPWIRLGVLCWQDTEFDAMAHTLFFPETERRLDDGNGDVGSIGDVHPNGAG